jgi:hypothetical protein
MSPNRFDVTIVERLRMGDHPRRERVDVYLRMLDGRVVLPHDLGDLVPQHHRMGQRVRLGRARQHLARPPGRSQL